MARDHDVNMCMQVRGQVSIYVMGAALFAVITVIMACKGEDNLLRAAAARLIDGHNVNNMGTTAWLLLSGRS